MFFSSSTEKQNKLTNNDVSCGAVTTVCAVQVSAITTAVAAATAGTAPEEKSTAPSLQNIATEACPNPSLDGAVRRIAHLLELLESVGEMEAWAKRVGGDGHSACRRLVDFAAAGGAGVLLSPGGVAVVASGFREERWAGVGKGLY